MDKLHSVASARDNLARLIHDAETGHTVKISRRGRPVAVLMSIHEYDRLIRTDGFQSSYKVWRQTWEKSLDDTPVFENVRDQGSGRDISL